MTGRSQKVLLDLLGYVAVVAIAALTIFMFRKPIDHAWTILIGKI